MTICVLIREFNINPGDCYMFMSLGDNCIQNFHLGRYVYRQGRKFSFTVTHVKPDFLLYIRRYTSPIGKFEYGYLHSNALLQFTLKLKHC